VGTAISHTVTQRRKLFASVCWNPPAWLTFDSTPLARWLWIPPLPLRIQLTSRPVNCTGAHVGVLTTGLSVSTKGVMSGSRTV
jgi:hypothetical protein